MALPFTHINFHRSGMNWTLSSWCCTNRRQDSLVEPMLWPGQLLNPPLCFGGVTNRELFGRGRAARLAPVWDYRSC